MPIIRFGEKSARRKDRNAQQPGSRRLPRGTSAVVVAMSGGVDFLGSRPALLKAEGLRCVGPAVTLQLYDHGAATHPQRRLPCAGQDVL